MALEITTNNVPRPLLSGWELTHKERSDLDYLAPADDENAWSEFVNQFFRYRGHVYSLDQFVRIIPRGESFPMGFQHYDHAGELSGWAGIQTDSFFSGIVIRYPADECGHLDGESIVVGSLYANSEPCTIR